MGRHDGSQDYQRIPSEHRLGWLAVTGVLAALLAGMVWVFLAASAPDAPLQPPVTVTVRVTAPRATLRSTITRTRTAAPLAPVTRWLISPTPTFDTTAFNTATVVPGLTTLTGWFDRSGNPVG